MKALGLALLLLATNAFSAPDIIVASLDYDNGKFTSVLKNQGTTTTPTVYISVSYLIDGAEHSYGKVMGAIAPGATISLTSTTAKVLPNGTYSVTAFADNMNRVVESDETNNKLTQEVKVGSVIPPAKPGAAYPGAEGGGALSQGGRGGDIIYVTNLNDSGAGSLRECIKASGERICVFRVGGTIVIKSLLEVSNPYLTIAGQTAPGGGILITNRGAVTPTLLGVSTHDVIIQYLRMRNAYNFACSDGGNSECGSTLVIYSGGYNVILDHNSTSWNQDEAIGVWDATSSRPRTKNITLSYNLMAEGLLGHSTGIVTGGNGGLNVNMTNVDMHHNLTMTNSHRNPLALNKSSRIVNNLYYNQDYYINQIGGGNSVDIIGNLYKLGPLNKSWIHEIQGFTAVDVNVTPGSPSLYLSLNKGYHQTNPAGDQWVMASKVIGENGSDAKGTPIPAAWRRATPLAATLYPITVQAATALDVNIIPHVGASRKLSCTGGWTANRDAVDKRLIAQYTTGTGANVLPKTEGSVGGFPVISNGSPCADDDKDGMADSWERSIGLNPANSADRNFTAANGYKNIENYLAGL